MTQFSIKDLADFSGIKPHTIRIWEQRFNFLKPNRTETARRVYNPEELNLFLEVMLLYDWDLADTEVKADRQFREASYQNIASSGARQDESESRLLYVTLSMIGLISLVGFSIKHS